MTELDYTFPSYSCRIDDYFGTIWEDGSVEFYSDGDVRIPLVVLRQFVLLAHKFMYEREKRGA
jgi:hypothetical protein